MGEPRAFGHSLEQYRDEEDRDGIPEYEGNLYCVAPNGSPRSIEIGWQNGEAVQTYGMFRAYQRVLRRARQSGTHRYMISSDQISTQAANLASTGCGTYRIIRNSSATRVPQ